MMVKLIDFAKKAALFLPLFSLIGCLSPLLTQQPLDLFGDIDDLAQGFERANSRLAARYCLLHCDERSQSPLQIALITAFDNTTSILIDTTSLQRAWERRFSHQTRCKLIWGQDWNEEMIAAQLETLRSHFFQRSVEKDRDIRLMLARIELIDIASDAPHQLCLRITWQDPLMRSEIDRAEVMLRLDPARFMKKGENLASN